MEKEMNASLRNRMTIGFPLFMVGLALIVAVAASLANPGSAAAQATPAPTETATAGVTTSPTVAATGTVDVSPTAAVTGTATVVGTAVVSPTVVGTGTVVGSPTVAGTTTAESSPLATSTAAPDQLPTTEVTNIETATILSSPADAPAAQASPTNVSGVLPQTGYGDDDNLFLWALVLMALSLLAIGSGAALARKRHIF